MEEIYMIEFYIQKIVLKCKLGRRKRAQDKALTVGIDFGRFASLVIRQNEFFNDLNQYDDTDESKVYDENDDKSEVVKENASAVAMLEFATDDRQEKVVPIKTTFNGGSSMLFSHNPVSLKQTFKLFPLEISVWNDDESEKKACVGVAKVMWDPEFLDLVTNSYRTCANLPPVTVKSKQKLTSEVNGSNIGELILLIRLTSLGKTVITRFRQANKGNAFIFRNREEKLSYKCKKYSVQTRPEHLKPVGILYETMEIQDPADVKAVDRKKKVSEELTAAGIDEGCVMFITGDLNREFTPCSEMPLPCGNANCRLTQMIKRFMLNETAKRECRMGPDIKPTSKQVLGQVAKQDSKCFQETADPCDESAKECGPNFLDQMRNFQMCEVCGGMSRTGQTCKPQVVEPCCPAVCAQTKGGTDKKKTANIETMLYNGLTKMLASKSGAHPEKAHEKSCCHK